MKASKVVVSIKVETLSVDAVPSKLYEMIKALDENENTSGCLNSDDGDSVQWSTETKQIEF